MNRKEAILVTMVVLATFVGGAFADTISTTQSRSTPRTTAIDIDALALVSGFSAYGVSSSGVELWSGTYYAEHDFSAAFSFAPVKGFSQVNSVYLTLVYASRGRTSL